ncbi:flagellar motor switch protein FliM [Thermincola ferriacetica]|uniref:Flagellar motor switch protein FliM n=1 Tax=Thermincola ferriacetica TaxID=281456 RepID=A0A0L6W5X2_9FIRM|nr:flagellar motor switch protein FliM [Thermincola ferriacetica]KNZ70876.1 flagellar motor switch protein FliM [Thermincola ferriacetica]
MSEILSQEEIDALLGALSAGEVGGSSETQSKKEDHKKIRVYDFKRPNKFSKEQIHTLQAIHENFARLLSTFLSAHLRTVVTMNVHSVEQITYDEFIRSLPNPTLLNIFMMEPLAGNAILEVNPNVTFTILDRLFGGPGQAPEKMRGLTDIERTVIEKVIIRCLQILKEAWENIIEFDPKLEVIETNPLFTQIVSPTEMVVLISIHATIGETEGIMNLCIPFIVLEPIISKLTAHFWFAGTAKTVTAEHIQSTQRRLEKAKITLSAVLGETTIKLGELLELQPGDVIQLDNRATDELKIMVGERKKFYGRPGTVGSRLAVQITRLVKEGDEDNE